MPKILRIHVIDDTLEIPVVGKGPKAAQTEAYYVMREGYWVNNTLYPPSRIVKIEVLG
jgi:hypothetical protein